MAIGEIASAPDGIKMGIGTFLPKEVLFKRRYRWLFFIGAYNNADGVSGNEATISPVCVTMASRPNLSIDETELNFLNEKGYVAAKPTWEPLPVTFLDFAKEGGGGADEAVLSWIRRCYYFDNPTSSGMMGDGGQYYKRTCAVAMYNGIGQKMEEWRLYGCWVQSSNWGDLDYAANENATIECSLRFDNAELKLGFGASGGAARPGTGAAVNTM